MTKDDDLTPDQLQLLHRCFDHIVPIRTLSAAPAGEEENHYWSTLRSKWWAFSLIEYTRVIFMDADQVSRRARAEINRHHAA